MKSVLLMDLRMRHLGQDVLVHDQIEYEGGTVWRRMYYQCEFDSQAIQWYETVQ